MQSSSRGSTSDLIQISDQNLKKKKKVLSFLPENKIRGKNETKLLLEAANFLTRKCVHREVSSHNHVTTWTVWSLEEKRHERNKTKGRETELMSFSFCYSVWGMCSGIDQVLLMRRDTSNQIRKSAEHRKASVPVLQRCFLFSERRITLTFSCFSSSGLWRRLPLASPRPPWGVRVRAEGGDRLDHSTTTGRYTTTTAGLVE